MKPLHKLFMAAGVMLVVGLFQGGCDASNVSFGVGYSGYSSNGIGYSVGVSSSGGGNYGSDYGSFGMTMYGRP